MVGQETRTWYFAYGSNMDLAQMQERKVSYWDSKRASLADYKLAFNYLADGYQAGVADIVKAPGETVEGALYLLDQTGLGRLDFHEGVAKRVYRRATIMVEDELGERIAAITYEVVTKSPRFIPPSKLYVGKIIRGAVAHHLSAVYIAQLKAIPTA